MPMKPIREGSHTGESSSLTKAGLQERAAELDISGRSSMTKDELAAAVADAESSPEG